MVLTGRYFLDVQYLYVKIEGFARQRVIEVKQNGFFLNLYDLGVNWLAIRVQALKYCADFQLIL